MFEQHQEQCHDQKGWDFLNCGRGVFITKLGCRGLVSRFQSRLAWNRMGCFALGDIMGQGRLTSPESEGKLSLSTLPCSLTKWGAAQDREPPPSETML